MLWLAAGWMVLVAAVHAVMGGREIARPLRRSAALDPVVRGVALMCWHFATVAMLAMAALFAAAAMGGGHGRYGWRA